MVVACDLFGPLPFSDIFDIFLVNFSFVRGPVAGTLLHRIASLLFYLV